MKTFTSYTELPDSARGGVLAIGNFDGMHRGHRALLEKAAALAGESGAPLAVLTFEPHPRALFRPDEPPNRITPADLKAARLEKEGIDVLFTLPFNWDFASLSAEKFIRAVLLEGIAPAHVVVGFDFRFGQMRKGTPGMIEAAGIPVTVVQEVKGAEDEDLSSSHIRQLLRRGDIEKANAILGWDWEIRGTVFRGDQRGRELGFPTANMKLEDVIHPAYGVYAALVQIGGEEEWLKAAINIGIRPMFEVKTAQVETHIFDFDRDIYDRLLRVRPVRLLRSEAKFENVDALIVQMEKDCAQAKEILERMT